jgi:uncharacterized protein YccT (UPF0319 family)
MATKTTTLTTVTDDIDGTEGAETITFGLRGATYEVDLNEKNAKKLEAALEPFLAVARKASTRRGSKAAPKNDGPAAADIRAWAKENSHEVPAMGRIPAAVREAYDKAH